jgi:hypothetical protein
MRSFVFIGFGKGLSDPNFDALFRWARSAFGTSEYRHYRLCLRSEKALIESDFRMADRVYAISYGDDYSELPDFLEGIRVEQSSDGFGPDVRRSSAPANVKRPMNRAVNAHPRYSAPSLTGERTSHGDTLSGTRIAHVRVAQMFRIADLLVFPENVRARRFHEVISNPSKLRRALNRPWGLQLGSLGLLKPAARITDRFDETFWRIGIPDFRVPTSQWLYLVPFEVNLSPHRIGFECSATACLGATFAQVSPLLNNYQITGLLRIYPPGVGVVRLSVTLGFRDAVHLPTLLNFARNIEDLLFVDPNDAERPCGHLFRDVVDEVAAALFVPSGITEDRRWRPPETLFTLVDNSGFRPEGHAAELARLLDLGHPSDGSAEDLASRMERSLHSPHWVRDHVLYAVSQRSALSFVGQSFAGGSKDKAHKMRDRLAETWELSAASAYATQAFSEEMHTITSSRQLSAEWLPGGTKFDYLGRVTKNFHAALALAKLQLQKQGAGVLMAFAKDLWTLDNPVDREELKNALAYVSNWTRNSNADLNDPRLASLLDLLGEIGALAHGFRPKQEALPIAG